MLIEILSAETVSTGTADYHEVNTNVYQSDDGSTLVVAQDGLTAVLIKQKADAN